MSGWNEELWLRFFDLLDKGWPGELEVGADKAYRFLLDGTDPSVINAGLRLLLHRGQRFRPSAAEIVAAAREDPSKPTFAEALRLIEHVLKARPPRGARYEDDPEPDDGEPRPAGWRSALRKRQDAEHQAVRDRLAAVHPLVAAFVERQGIDRLRRLELDDPDWGEKRRADLEAEWDDHVARFDGRDVAAIAAGARPRRGQLSRLDPLAVLGVGQGDAPQLDRARADIPEEAPA